MSLSDKLFGQEPDRTYGPDALPTIEPAEHARWRKNRNKVIAKGVGVVTAIAAAISLAVGGVVANDRWQARQEAVLQEFANGANCGTVDNFIIIGDRDPNSPNPNFWTNAELRAQPGKATSIGQDNFIGYVNQSDPVNNPYTSLGKLTVCVANTPDSTWYGFVPSQSADPGDILVKNNKYLNEQVWVNEKNVA